jgi:cobalt-zinc-cadmium resistance protein CzcA
LPRLDYTRSLSRYGLSQVTVVFEDGTDIYFARQQVAERLQQSRSQLPDGHRAEMGPIATGLGEIFMYTVEAEPGAHASRRPALDADRPAHAAGLGDPPAAAQRAGRHRGQHHRRLRAQIHITPDPAPAGVSASRCNDVLSGRMPQQRQCRRRLHRTQRRAVPGARPRARSRR